MGGADLNFLSPQPDTSIHCDTMNTGLVQCMVCISVFAGTHCAYPRRDGQAELTWVAGYIHRPNISTKSTNGLTALIVQNKIMSVRIMFLTVTPL